MATQGRGRQRKYYDRLEKAGKYCIGTILETLDRARDQGLLTEAGHFMVRGKVFGALNDLDTTVRMEHARGTLFDDVDRNQGHSPHARRSDGQAG